MTRIGREARGKARPVIIELNEVWVKWELVKRGKNLKEDRDDINQKVIIAPDLTRKEREENERLREELRERRNSGGKWTIKKGKVIQISTETKERNQE